MRTVVPTGPRAGEKERTTGWAKRKAAMEIAAETKTNCLGGVKRDVIAEDPTKMRRSGEAEKGGVHER